MFDRDAYAIMGSAVLGAVCFGVVHDQITVRLSLEYFTVAHERLFSSDSPTLHAAAWGVLATWWVGLILGTAIAFAARGGRVAPLPYRSVLPTMVAVLAATSVAAAMGGFVSWWLVSTGRIGIPPRLAPVISPAQHDGFTIAMWIHSTSYAAGAVTTGVASIRLWIRRVKAGKRASSPEPSFGRGVR